MKGPYRYTGRDRRAATPLWAVIVLTVLTAVVGVLLYVNRGASLTFVADEDTPDATPLAEVAASPEPIPPEGVPVEGVIQPGENLFASMTALEIEPEQCNRIVDALREIDFPFTNIHPGQSFTVWIRDDGICSGMDFRVDPLISYEVREAGEGLTAARSEIPTTIKVETLGARVATSVYQAIVDHGESDELASLVSQLFGWDINFYSDPRVGDAFKLIFERRVLPDGQHYGYGRLLAAEYDGEVTGIKRGFWLEVGNEDWDGFYDEKGQQLKKTFLVAPLDTMRITSGFGMRRHPILGGRRMHAGVDYGAAVGTPVWAVADGQVVSAGYAGAAGNMVRLRHGGGYITTYMHLSRVGVRAGQHVRQRQMIGRVGSTGRSTGPHLDFRVLHNGGYINPTKLRMIAEPLKKLTAEYRPAFEETMGRLEPQLTAIVLPSKEEWLAKREAATAPPSSSPEAEAPTP